jgi:hypothetical protein
MHPNALLRTFIYKYYGAPHPLKVDAIKLSQILWIIMQYFACLCSIPLSKKA